MGTDLNEQLTRIGHKSELLVTRYSTLLASNRALREELAEKEAELSELYGANERLRAEAEYLRISGAIAPDSGSAVEARAVLSELVREIDACIAMIIKDL